MTKPRSSHNPPTQLVLVDTPRMWRLDQHTRDLGREGIARARAALREGVRRRPAPGPPTHPNRPIRPVRPGREAA